VVWNCWSRLRGRYGLVGVIVLWQISPVWASYPTHRHHHHRAYRAVHVSVPLYHAELLMDADSGRVLYELNDRMQWPPASMAKMMLLAVAVDQIKAGRFSYSDPVLISERAASTEGSRLGLHAGDIYPLGELMKAALIRSANDATVAVAEKIAGSVEACVRLMNLKAQELAMTDTHYETVDGLPPRPNHDVDYTSALDLAILARSIIHNTDLLRWSSLAEAPFDGGPVMLHNTNHLIGHLDGCDGLKTGFTNHAGFNLTATVKRGDMRLISVVLGAPSNAERFIQSSQLLGWGFDNFTKLHLVNRGQVLPVHVQVQSGPLIQPVADDDVALVLPKNQVADVKVEYTVQPTVQGPVVSGESLGQVLVLDGADVVSKVDAICPTPAGGYATNVDSASANAGENPASASGHEASDLPQSLITTPATSAPQEIR
jgi:serine-type D-Ala-D-Ala carboxypeptidase (penicillin-binding protein 5/6)